MSKTISKQKAQRIMGRLQEGAPVSDKAMGQLARYQGRVYSPQGGAQDRTIRALKDSEHATVSYIHTLLEPELGEDVGVSILPGGLATNSAVVSLRQTKTITCNSAGNCWLAMYAPAAGSRTGVDNPESASFAKVPGVGSHAMGVFSSTTSGNSLPAPGTALAATDNSLVIPSTGLDLTNAAARLVSMSLRVYPTSNFTNSQGTGMIARFATPFEAANATDFAGVYSARRNEVCMASLGAGSFGEGDCFRVVYLPTRQAQLWFQDCPTASSTVIGFPWGCFMATGCTSSTTFRFEVVANYEILLNTLTLGSNRLVSDHGMDVVVAASHVAKPAVEPMDEYDDKTVSRRPHHVAKAVGHVYGPSKAAKIFKSIKAGVSKVGSFLAGASNLIAPALSLAAPLALKAITGGIGGKALSGGANLLLKSALR